MKEATWVIIALSAVFIGTRLGVVILPEMAKGYVNLNAATAPSPGASPSPAASPTAIAPATIETPAQPAADGGTVNMGGAEAW